MKVGNFGFGRLGSLGSLGSVGLVWFPCLNFSSWYTSSPCCSTLAAEATLQLTSTIATRSIATLAIFTKASVDQSLDRIGSIDIDWREELGE